MVDLNSMLDEERKRLEKEQADLHEQLRQGADRLALVKERLKHVQALLNEEQVSEGGDENPRASPRVVDGIPRNVCDITVEILSERDSEPMYYKELAQEVVRRGGILNGATPWATLSARMVRDSRFVRPTAKGFYALRRDFPTARNVGARTVTSRRRRNG